MMDAELRRRFEALRRPLVLAAADGFRGVAKIGGLGDALRVACDRVLELQPSDPLRAWRAGLAQFERLDQAKQAVEVARGLRLVQTVAGAAGAQAPVSVLTKNPARAETAPKRARRSPDPEPTIDTRRDAPGGRSPEPSRPEPSADLAAP